MTKLTDNKTDVSSLEKLLTEYRFWENQWNLFDRHLIKQRPLNQEEFIKYLNTHFDVKETHEGSITNESDN